MSLERSYVLAQTSGTCHHCNTMKLNTLPTETVIQILKNVDFEELKSIELTSKAISPLAAEERKRRLRPILQRFKLPDNTFSTFNRLGVYISGAVALQLALNQPQPLYGGHAGVDELRDEEHGGAPLGPLWEDSDLDLYVQLDGADDGNNNGASCSAGGTKFAQLESFIKDASPGYRACVDQDVSVPPMEVKSFLHSSGSKIRIISVSSVSVPEYIVSHSFSLHIMNWLHNDSLTVCYPYNVYNKLIELGNHPRAPDNVSDIEKYSARGFRFDGMTSPYQILCGAKLRGAFVHTVTMQQVMGLLTMYTHTPPDRAEIVRMLTVNLGLVYKTDADTGDYVFRRGDL